MAHITTIGIVRAGPTDGCHKIAVYSDGSEKVLGGWHGSFDEAEVAAQEWIGDMNAAREENEGLPALNVAIEDWTGDDEE